MIHDVLCNNNDREREKEIVFFLYFQRGEIAQCCVTYFTYPNAISCSPSLFFHCFISRHTFHSESSRFLLTNNMNPSTATTTTASVKGGTGPVYRIPPYHYIHVLDQNTNVTRLEIGPKTFIKQDNESVIVGPEKMITVPYVNC
jgi:hypothetical protein